MKNKNKQKILANNAQYYVRFHSKEEWIRLFYWLQKQGYNNVHNYTEELYPKRPFVLCIDEIDRVFGGTNITCIACAVSLGHRIIEFEEYLIRRNRDKTVSCAK